MAAGAGTVVQRSPFGIGVQAGSIARAAGPLARKVHQGWGHLRWVAVAILMALNGVALAAESRTADQVGTARRAIPEDQLLDVGIRIFDTGVPAEPHLQGVFPEIRKAEARFLPIHLRDTLQATGHWGMVRVVPEESTFEVQVTGRIVASASKRLVLEVRVVDVAGQVWFDRRYREAANESAYDLLGGRVGEPFQALYDRIADDLLEARSRLTAGEIERLQTVSEMRFAANLLPAAFAGHLRTGGKGRSQVRRLPALDDPMLARIRQIRLRDLLLIDALNQLYSAFYVRMGDSYLEWRRFSLHEEQLLREIRRSLRKQRMASVLDAFGALLQVGSEQSPPMFLEVGATGAGTGGTRAGKVEELEAHLQTVRELNASFEAEMSPLLVEIEGQTLRLMGSAESQYSRWRQLLRELFAAETGGVL